MFPGLYKAPTDPCMDKPYRWLLVCMAQGFSDSMVNISKKMKWLLKLQDLFINPPFWWFTLKPASVFFAHVFYAGLQQYLSGSAFEQVYSPVPLFLWWPRRPNTAGTWSPRRACLSRGCAPTEWLRVKGSPRCHEPAGDPV